MDKYNHWLGHLFLIIFGKKTDLAYAVTFGQTTYYSCYEACPAWRRHEDCHKMQWARDGRVKFLSSYIWQWVTKGYQAISYEQEARAAELI